MTGAWLPDGCTLRRRLGLWSLELVGENVLAPDARERVGLARDGCLGAAAVGDRGQTTVAFACLSDADRFTREVLRVWKPHDQRLETELLDDGWALLSGDSPSSALLVGPSLALFLHDEQGAPVRSLARSMAELPPERSVGSSAAFVSLLRELPDGDLHAYVDAGALARGALGLAPDLPGRTRADATAHLERTWQSSLDRARASGQPAERLIALDEDFRARRRQVRDDSEARRAREWVGSTGPLGLSLDARPNGLAARALWLMGPDAELQSLVRFSADPVETVREQARRPALFVRANLDAERVGRLVDYLLERELSGEPKTPAANLLRHLREQWTGALGLVCSPSPDDASDGPLQLIAEVGLRDGLAVRRALDRMIAEQAAGPVASVPGLPGRYRLEVPGVGQWALSVDEGGLVVIAGTRPPSSSAAPAAMSKWSGTGARVMQRLAEAPASALVAAVDVGLVRAIADALGRAPLEEEPSETSAESTTAGAPSGAAAADGVAATADGAVASAASLMAKRIAAIDERLEGGAPWGAAASSSDVGVLGLRLASDRLGWAIELVWVAGARSIAEALDPWVKQLVDEDVRGADPLEPLWRERDELEAERERLMRRTPAPSPGAPSQEQPGAMPSEGATPNAGGQDDGRPGDGPAGSNP